VRFFMFMEEITGFIDHIIFRNEENGYTVLVMIPDDPTGDEEIDEEGSLTCTGSFPAISQGECLRVRGEYKTHVTFGRQFDVKSYEVVVPQDAEAILRYLSTGAIKGIGPALAKRIVKAFGDDTFRIMEEEPERLAEIKGISEKKAMEVSDQMMERRDVRRASVFLGQYGISPALSVKLYDAYGDQIYDILRENPYRLADEVTGIGFRIADEIAKKSGIAFDAAERVDCGLIYILQEAESNGHTYLPGEELISRAVTLLGVGEDLVKEELESMMVNRRLTIKKDRVYLPGFYRMEGNVASRLMGLNGPTGEDYEEVEARIYHLISKERLVPDDMQKKALVQAATHGLMVLTGGPGTGKTTTLRMMISYFESTGEEIFLAAPTGRAAKRMSEATGREAKTIHRLLEVKGRSDDQENTASFFDRNEDNPLECDVLIVDEMSMVDLPLMSSLLRAIPEHCRVIFVGDTNQLPSVGPGNVLRDMIDSEMFPVVRLETIFRQDETGDIVINAHEIQEGHHVDLGVKSKDFLFLERPDSDHVLAAMLPLLRDKLPAYVHSDVREIQVLSPMRKGEVGVTRLNKILQQSLNPPAEGKAEKSFGDRIFREGDKVMQIKNNYQTEWEITGKFGVVKERGEGIFNGDIGIIKEISEYASLLIVEFDDEKTVRYPFTQLDELELAYAVTIHKSQGSEYPAVILPLLPGPKMLMNRNLLYTAITRARECVVLIGHKEVFYDMIDNTNQQRRYSSLKERIVACGE